MKKNTKHNLLVICLYILLGLLGCMIWLFIYGIKNNISLVIILSSIGFCCFSFLIILVFKYRPFKNKQKKKKIEKDNN